MVRQTIVQQKNISIKGISAQIQSKFPFLHYLTIAHIVGLVFCIIAIGVDDRQLTGINVWIKPAKFLISTIVLLWTIGWYLLHYPFSEKSQHLIAIGLTSLLTFENILISIQAYRGVNSHYNIATPFDAAIFSAMGFAIGLITLYMVWFLLKSFSSKLDFSNHMKWGFRIAWFALIFGSAVGGSAMIEQSAHSVGIADGGSGIPFLNWSTEGGDLRVAHFLGLHAIQIIPLVIFFLEKKMKFKSAVPIISIGFAGLYLAFIIFTYYQAKAGVSFFHI